MNKLLGTVMAGAVMVVLAVPGAVRAQEALAARQEGFKASKAAMGAIKDILAGRQAIDAALPHAEALHRVALAVPGWFPPGSDQGKTEAKPAVWSDATGFAAASARFATASQALLVAVQAGDPAAVQARFGELGGTCKSCHDSYRAE
jgi:cytochrome c556